MKPPNLSNLANNVLHYTKAAYNHHNTSDEFNRYYSMLYIMQSVNATVRLILKKIA